MWTSSQPFVLPVQITNFKDVGVPDKAKEIQANSKLLSSISDKIIQALNDPILITIREKHSEVEKLLLGASLKEKTQSLFRKLDDREKEYLRKAKALQEGYDGKEFAVKFPFYGYLSSLSGSAVEG
jgi:hypothetical protein